MSDDRDVTVRDNPSAGRFELDAEGETAVAYYRVVNGVMIFTHTEVAPHLRGRGIAERLVRGALEQARARSLRVQPRCPYVARVIARLPEFQALLA